MILAELEEGKPAPGVSGLFGTEFGIHTLHFCFESFYLLWNRQYSNNVREAKQEVINLNTDDEMIENSNWLCITQI